jgi:hypothetical protein
MLGSDNSPERRKRKDIYQQAAPSQVSFLEKAVLYH